MLLNINANIIWTVVDLLILFLLMKKFLFGPVTAMLDQRAAAITADLDDAKQQKQQADALRADHECQITEARAEAGRILADAKRRGEAAYEQRVAQAQEEIQRMQQEAARQIEADRRAMLAQTRREIAQLSLQAASKVAGRRMTTNDDFALVDDFLSEMEDAS